MRIFRKEKKVLKLISGDKKQTEVRFIKRLYIKKGPRVGWVAFANIFNLWDYLSDFDKKLLKFVLDYKLSCNLIFARIDSV